MGLSKSNAAGRVNKAFKINEGDTLRPRFRERRMSIAAPHLSGF